MKGLIPSSRLVKNLTEELMKTRKPAKRLRNALSRWKSSATIAGGSAKTREFLAITSWWIPTCWFRSTSSMRLWNSFSVATWGHMRWGLTTKALRLKLKELSKECRIPKNRRLNQSKNPLSSWLTWENL